MDQLVEDLFIFFRGRIRFSLLAVFYGYSFPLRVARGVSGPCKSQWFWLSASGNILADSRNQFDLVSPGRRHLTDDTTCYSTAGGWGRESHTDAPSTMFVPFKERVRPLGRSLSRALEVSRRGRMNFKALRRRLAIRFERERRTPHECPGCRCFTEVTEVSRSIDVTCPACGAIFNSFTHEVSRSGDPDVRCEHDES